MPRSLSRLAVALSAVACLALLPGTARADKCASSKLKAAAKKASCLLGLDAKEAKTGEAKDAAKVTACGDKMLTAFGKAEAKGCLTTGDGAAIEAKVDAFVDDIDTDLSVAIPNACQSSKLKAVGKKAKCLLGLEAKEAAKGTPPDPLKVQKCIDKFSGSFAKAEAKGGCSTTADETPIENKVDAFVNDVDDELVPCGNGVVEVGEDCDPPGSACGTTSTCNSSCKCTCDTTECPCDPLDGSACLYPFPNDFYTVADNTKDTGLRVNIAAGAMPRNNNGVTMDNTEYNRADGFSPGSSILVRVPEIDLAMTGAAPITDIAQSLNANAPILVINATTLAQHLLFTELDSLPTEDSHRTLIIRPSVNFKDGERYIVVLRNLKRANGSTIEPTPEFLAYRDNIPGDAATEARRPHMEDLFTTLNAAGIARNELYLTWDFTVASTRGLTERMLFMRDDGFSRLGANAPSFTVTAVYEHACTAGSNINSPCAVDADCPGGGAGSCTGTGIDSRIFRQVRGTYNVDRYVDSTTAPARLVLDANGLPVHQATPQPASFICNIPFAALPSAAGPAVPARASIYGHGLLGSNTEVSSGNVKDMANEHNFVFCATKWIGMSDEDIGNAINILQELGKFPSFPDRQQQAMLNQLYLARLMIHPNGFTSNPAFQDASANPVIDTSAVFYDGNSQGGIFGGTIMSIAQDITRGVLGVPGMNYSLLLTRSVDFDVYAAFLYPSYPNELTRPLLLHLIQMLWDRSEPNGYANHMTADPLPGTPVHTVLLHEAFGDHQVTNVATEIEARTIGASIHAPPLGAGRSYEVTPAYGIPAIASYPFNGSALVIWDSGTPTPPTANMPNEGGSDPHGKPRANANARMQKSEFLKTGGSVIDVCSGLPCLAP
jgi:hypothetical protein